MIQIHENTNWIAQNYFALGILCFFIAALSVSAFIAIFAPGLTEGTFDKYSKILLGIGLGALFISGCLVFALYKQGPHYSGSNEYAVKDVKQNAKQEQILVIDDGKRSVDLKVDDEDNSSYDRGDKVRIKVTDYGSSLSKGEYHLGDALKPQHKSPSSIIINVTYDIEKVK